jgi:hypothetical protein
MSDNENINKYEEIDKEEETLNQPQISNQNSDTDLNLELNQEQLKQEELKEENLNQEQPLEQPLEQNQVIEETQKEEQEQVQPTESSQEITIKVDKSALISLCQNLNSNIIVNVVAYKGILTKLMETENDSEKKTQISNNITSLDEILSNSKNVMESMQDNLNIAAKIDPSKIEEEASKTTNLSDQLISAQVTSILASLATAAILAGGKKTKRKNTKRNQNKVKGKKQTKKRT